MSLTEFNEGFGMRNYLHGVKRHKRGNVNSRRSTENPKSGGIVVIYIA